MRRLIAFAALALSITSSAHAQDIVSDWFDAQTSSAPHRVDGERRGYLSGGSFSGRYQMTNDYLFSAAPPRVASSCNGIDMFGGGISYLDPEYLVQKMENILQAAPAVAFSMALNGLCKQCENITSKMENVTNMLNGIQLNDCQAANRIVQWANPNDPATVQRDIRNAVHSVGQELGLTKNAQDANEDMDAAGNQAPFDTFTTIENCPADFLALLTSGSIAEAAATQVGMDDYAPLVRGYLGDVSITWPNTDNLPSFEYFPPCPENDSGSLTDFAHGRVFGRNVLSDACEANAADSLVEIVNTRMTSIGGKLYTGTVLTAQEIAFLEQVSGQKVFTRLKTAARSEMIPAMVVATEQVVSLEYAYEMFGDLIASIDHLAEAAIAETSTPGVENIPGSDRPCDPRLLRPGIAYLVRVRDRVRELQILTRADMDAALARESAILQQAALIYGAANDERGDSTSSFRGSEQ
jgi:conjugative transfer pilus assembly protein TraH